MPCLNCYEQKWWSRAIQINASQVDDRKGSLVASQCIRLFLYDLFFAMLSNGKHLSMPITSIPLFTDIFLPFPQPTSNTILPLLRWCKKLATLGQGLYLVYEKCPAILS